MRVKRKNISCYTMIIIQSPLHPYFCDSCKMTFNHQNDLTKHRNKLLSCIDDNNTDSSRPL